MPTPRYGKPYVWTTWVTGLLSGEDQCRFAVWFKAHFKFEKRERDFNLSAWKATHAEMVQARAEELRAAGYTVMLEDQNAFKVEGESALLSGKADIVASRDQEIVVVDCKGGKPGDKDLQQVLIYLYALTKQRPMFAPAAGFQWRGEVCYGDHRRTVDYALVADLVPRLGALMRVIGDRNAPPATPSQRECAFCDLDTSECPNRITAPAVETVAVGDF